MSIKSINLLPEIFRTENNRKFLTATLDQLVSESNSQRLDSFVGRRDAVTLIAGDTYVAEPTTLRQDYQLETSVIVDAGQGQTDFYASYVDMLAKLQFHGGLTNDHSRLFTNESYTFDGAFDFDKFVNFSQYLWLPNGPPAVVVSAATDAVIEDFNVTRNVATQGYEFTEFGTDRNPIITLVKGETYRFHLNQPGHKFWIQTKPGVSSGLSQTASFLEKQILGVTNNGIDSGILTFHVPADSTQNDLSSAKLAATVDFAVDASYKDIQSHLTSVLALRGGIDGTFDSLDNKTLIFVNQDTDNDAWTDPGNFDFYSFDQGPSAQSTTILETEGFSAGDKVPGEKRRGVFRIRAINVGSGRKLIKLESIQDVGIGEKVYVAAGNKYSGVEFIHNRSGIFDAIPPITANLTELFYQDDTDPDFFGTIRLVNGGVEKLNVIEDIVGKVSYTSPNHVALTNGMHIRFDSTAIPALYSENNFIVEGVGTGIKLINIGEFQVPEDWAVNSQLQQPDYITINRGSNDLNAWTRSNRWFHVQTIELAAKYNNDPRLLFEITNTNRAKRPIIEFDPNLYLYGYGNNAKSPVDLLDFTITDAFSQVEGKSEFVLQMPNGVTRPLTPGTRIIFANDTDPEVRNRIYRVEQVVTETSSYIHLVSQDTRALPTYSVSGTLINKNQLYDYIPAVTFSSPYPGIGNDTATGKAILANTGVQSLSVAYSGMSYIADPYISINSNYTTQADLQIVYKPYQSVDFIRIDDRGTGYSSTNPAVSLSNPNRYYGAVNVSIADSGTVGSKVFKIDPGVLTGAPVTVNLSTDVSGNLVASFANLGFGYFASNVGAVISSNVIPSGSAAVVNGIYLYANGAIKAVNMGSVGSGYTTTPTISFTGANTYSASANVTTSTGSTTKLIDFLAPGMLVVGNGIIGGTVINSIDRTANLISLDSPAVVSNITLGLSGLSTVANSDVWAFKSASTAGTYATVATSIRNELTVTVDSTSIVDAGMVVTGGIAPIAIAQLRIDVVPTRIITSGNHGLIDGDLILLRDIVGTTELNFNRYFVRYISETAIDLYSNEDLSSAQDSRNLTAYVSGGTVTAYTLDHAAVKVVRVLGPTQFTVNQSVTLKAGMKLIFTGRTASALARADGRGIFSISVTDPGSGYNVPAVVSIASSSGNQANATAIMNDDIISYIQVQDPGAGYQIGSTVETAVISQLDLTISETSPRTGNVLYFADYKQLIPVQAGWLVFWKVIKNGQEIYTDFSQTPYATTETTGPNAENLNFAMDVTQTQAVVRRVISVDSDRLVLDGPINSLDSDGEPIDLPAGSEIHVTAQSRFFLVDGAGSGAIVSGSSYAGYTVITGAAQEVFISLDTVLGIQPGMLLQDLASTLQDNVVVVAVDAYTKRVQLNQAITINSGQPVRFDMNASMSVVLAPALVASISISNAGAGYSSAPIITIDPKVPSVTLLASSDGTDVLSVDSYAGVALGAKVTSDYTMQGVGATTGANVAVVTELFRVQTGAATFANKIRVSKPQPVFAELFVKFTLAAEAVALVELKNNAIDYADNTPETYDVGDTVTVNVPSNESQLATTAAYNQFYFNGVSWLPAQQKNNYNQEPLFDVFNRDGYSAGDGSVYTGTKFVGTKIFGYTPGTGTPDQFLGIPLSYKNFQNVGDVQFTNYFQSDTFGYLSGFTETSLPINTFVLKQGTGASTFKYRNVWTKVSEPSKQYQTIYHQFDGTTNYFEIDILPEPITAGVPNIKVYSNRVRVPDSMFSIKDYGGRTAVVIDTSYLKIDTQVKIKIYSRKQSSIGSYDTPINLDHNPMNTNFGQLTLGQVRNHLLSMVDSHYGTVGEPLGSNNLRDLYIKNWQGSILQHASPIPAAALTLGESDIDLVKSIDYARREYTKFKYRFLDQANKQLVNPEDIPAGVDQLLASLMMGKSKLNSWYQSDMVPYGNKFRKITAIPVLDIRQQTYLIPMAFDPVNNLQLRAVLVYIKDPASKRYDQLTRDYDFRFDATTSSITFIRDIGLTYTSQLMIVDYADTSENYIPETPTKLGLYPKFRPTIFVDNTYRTPITVIQGHDGSITPTFGDLRDQLLLELELRIYNNIKVDYDDTLLDLYNTQPGKFRDTGYTRQEFVQLLTPGFLTWSGTNRLDHSTNKFYSPSDPWSWNYSRFKDLMGEQLVGSWRGIYKYFYDTDRPHTHPWEMLGFSQQPTWWEDAYGMAPYTSGNDPLWSDLETGTILHGTRAGVDTRFARPGLTTIIPVDEVGNLVEPIRLMVSNYDATSTSIGFSVGDDGPVETAWKRSSDYPYAIQVALMLARPAFYLGTLFDNSRYRYDAALGQITVPGTRQRIQTAQVSVPDNGAISGNIVLASGYGNWLRDYARYLGFDGTALIKDSLLRLDVRLSYRMAGFTSKNMLTVIAEQSSPNGSGHTIIVPDENYRVYLNKSSPTKRVVYSAVIVEKTQRGWSVSGYDTTNPYFTIVPSLPNNNAVAINEAGIGVLAYKDYQGIKAVIPYGYEFLNHQQLADFLTSYGRYLALQGFVFGKYNNAMETTQDWNLSIREFLTWSRQGWREGSVLILSPMGANLEFSTTLGIIDDIGSNMNSSKLLDANFKLIRSSEYFTTRDSTNFTVTTTSGKIIALADLNLVEYEHVLIFDNATVFADTIYLPELGNRQSRLRLIGFKTGEWNGQLSAPGYVYNNDTVEEWKQNTTYPRGSLVSYKDTYFAALEKAPSSLEFNYRYWKTLEKTALKTGLLPNYSNTANKLRYFYDTEQMNRDENADKFSNGLIGFRERSFLSDLGIDPQTQVKFYQGYIKQKGTKNAVTSLTAGNFDRVSSEVSYFEEWGLRVGEYGATGSDQYIEVVLNEGSFNEDPVTFTLLNKDETAPAGVIGYDPYTIYRYSEEVYNPQIVKSRTDLLPRITDNITAGYPRIDDVDATIYDISDYVKYDALVKSLGAGFKLWTAVDFNKSWNVYRATETDVQLAGIQRFQGARITFIFNAPHGSVAGDLICIKNFTGGDFDGFYRVLNVIDSLQLVVLGYKNLNVFQQVTLLEGSGVYFRMASVRFKRVSEIISFTPPHGWRNNDHAWIDSDTGENLWGVYKKTDGWDFNQILPLRQGEDRFREGYGSEVRLSVDNTLLLAGTPKYTAGSLSGLKVINPGSNYINPVVRIDYPTGPKGVLAQFTTLKDNGTLVYANVATAGSGYTVAPNVSITDTYSFVSTAQTLNENYIYYPLAANSRVFAGDTVTGIAVPSGTVVLDVEYTQSRIKVQPGEYAGLTSATSIPIGTGTTTFVMLANAAVAANVGFRTNQIVRAYPFGDLARYMQGYIVSYVGTTLTVQVESIQGTGSATSWTIVPASLSLPTATTITLTRGAFGRVVSKLAPTSIDYIELVSGGSGFVLQPQIEIIGGGGTGATASLSISGGSVEAITITNPGSGYTEPPEVIVLTNNPTPIVLRARLKPTGLGNLIVTDTGTGYRQPVLTVEASTLDRGAGATAGLSFYGNGGIQSFDVTAYGRGYFNGTIVGIDNSATGSGFAGTARFTANSVSMVSSGTGYYVGNIVSIIGGARVGTANATVTVTKVTNTGSSGSIVSYSLVSGGLYTTTPNNKSVTTTSTSGTGAVFDINYRLANVVITNPGSGYDTVNATANIFYPGGSGGTGTVQRTVNGIAPYSLSQAISFGQGYLETPTVSIVDLAESGGSGAVVEPVFPSGQVKTFLRPSQNNTQVEETQVIVPFSTDAKEFGFSISIGTILAAIGAPGSYHEQGGVLISQTLGSQWISYQMLFPPDASEGGRFGHSIAMSKDQQWIYVGAPGQNKVYAYGRKSQTAPTYELVPSTGQLSYQLGINFLGIQSNSELKVLGANGKIYEPGFDYAVDSGGGIAFADYDRIGYQPAVYITRQRLQTTIKPTVVRNIIQRTYTLRSRPESIDQLLVYGATGRVFVPNKEYTVVGSNLTFLDDGFLSEPTLVVTQREVFYKLVDILTPTDEIRSPAPASNFGWSVRTDEKGYRIVVGSPGYPDVDVDGDVLGAGRAYVFNRSYESTLASGNTPIFSLGILRSVVSVSLDNILLTNLVDYEVEGNSIRLSKVPTYGAKVTIDTNFFNIIQVLKAPVPVNQGKFGATVDLSPDNKVVVIGSPGYRDADYYNGAVYRYVNKGLYYGTVTTTKNYLTASVNLSETIKINDSTVTFSQINPGSYIPYSTVYETTFTNKVTVTSNVGLSVGDILVSNAIPASSKVRIVTFNEINTTSKPYYANITINTPITLVANETVTFQRNGDNIELIKKNIDASKVTAVSAEVTSDGNLTISLTGSTSLKSLDILPGAGTALDGIGLEVYALTQTIEHPRYGVPEKFGTQIKIDNTGQTLVIASEGGNTLKTSTFDNAETLYDRDTTRFIDSLNISGAVYVYDYLSPPGETLTAPGKLLYNQVLQNAYILTRDNFGSSVDVNKGWALVGADRSDYHGTDAGAVHLFVNAGDVKGWSRLRERGEEVDIDYINKALMYNKKKQVSIQDLDYYDPVKGKILGIVDQDLDYKTNYDPAQYNTGTSSAVTISAGSQWGSGQEGQTWWDISLCRYIDYEQGDINYRSKHWGDLFPGSVIQVAEWVRSAVLPSQYAATTGDGEAKYPDDSAYVTNSYVDQSSGLVKTEYYYWVINKRQYDRNTVKRNNSVVTLEQLLLDPKSQGIAYLAAISNNAFNIYNVRKYLNSDNTVLRLEYSRVISDVIAHNEYELIQEGSQLSSIPSKLVSKLVDSLSGENATGQVVPDLKLSAADAYGINFLPRQSMIKAPLAAAKVFVTFVNNVLKTRQITFRRNLVTMLLKEPVPPVGTGFYHDVVDTPEQLNYIAQSNLFIGYKVLVTNDTDYFNYWTIYEYQKFVGFRMVRIQSYDTSRWWSYSDWYATGYDQFTQIDYVVPRFVDIYKLDLVDGDTVKVLDAGRKHYIVYKLVAGSLVEIIVEDGTIQLNNSLFDPALSRIGFDNTAFDQVGFSTTQSVELRNIFNALVNEIFIEEDTVQTNNLFFSMLNYILSEQLSVDWALKTSLISVLHKIRKLEQFPNYILDNQDYYEAYINEVKPYRTQIREYLLDYEGLDPVAIGTSDFDMPSLYDKSVNAYRTLDKNNARDLLLIQGSSRANWLANYAYQIQEIVLNTGGSGYTAAPRVSITGGGGTGATARAVLGPLNANGRGSVVQLILTAHGNGYTSTPTVNFIGGNGSGATASVVLVQDTALPITIDTLNKKIRSITTKLKFDRVSYTGISLRWKPYEIFHPGDIVVVDDVILRDFANYTERSLPRYTFAYEALKTLTGRASVDLNIFGDTSLVRRLTGGEIGTTNERIAAFRRPGRADSARIYSSPNTIRLDSASINDQIISTGKQWNAVRHSVFYPHQHGYQYAAAGDGSLVATSKDGVNWVTNRIIDTTINGRDLTFYRNYTWMVVANQGTLITTDDGVTWSKTQITQYRYGPNADNLRGRLQENTAQTLDLTGVASAMTTFNDLAVVVGDSNTILASALGYSRLLTGFADWCNITLQNPVEMQNYMKVISVDFGHVTDIDTDDVYQVVMNQYGYIVQSAELFAQPMKKGVVFTAGVNGAINAITYNALDDYMNGYLQGYTFTPIGRNGNPNYPWTPMRTPSKVHGIRDGFSGEQIRGLAVSGVDTNWIVAVGSGGTLMWNQFSLSTEVQVGRPELAPNTVGTVIDYSYHSFDNFRFFDTDNFVAPLTRDALDKIDFYDVTWDGEKFVAVGSDAIILWGYPGAMAGGYIDFGAINPSLNVNSKRESAYWSATTGTSLVISIPTADIDGLAILSGMKAYSVGLPAGSIVQSVTTNSGNFDITIVFSQSTVVAGTDRALSFEYGLTAPITVGSSITATSKDGRTVTMTVSQLGAVGDNRIYVSDYNEAVQADWRVSGTGIPATAKINSIGKFASFDWQLAPGVVLNNAIAYHTVSVNTSTIEISKPLINRGNVITPITGGGTITVGGVFAGNVITFFDNTGAPITATASQEIASNSTILAFGYTGNIAIGYQLQANAYLGIPEGAIVTSVTNFNLAGVVSGLEKDIPELVPGTGYTGSRVTGTAFTQTNEDALNLDTQMTSEFADSLLGQRPEDILVDGGKFIDTYSSHAPEELVPGQVIDSLQMNIFTKDPNGSDVVMGYKIFTDYKLPTTYYRLSDSTTTTLANALAYNATEISVTDISKLPDSGSIWVNAEKITYLQVDRATGKLSDLRRGTARTSIPQSHPAGSLAVDASSSQLVDTDIITAITENITVENGIIGGGNSATYLSSAVTSIAQGRIWQDDIE